MSIVQGLFYSTDGEKSTLHKRITPSQEQQDVQQERWNDLRDYLIEDLSEKTGHNVTSWLQGSYKFGTQIRPAKKGEEFDIDLGLYFHWQGDRDSGVHTPAELKNLVQSSILQYKEDSVDGEELKILTPPKERCARLHFPGDFHIDVATYFEDQEADKRFLATESSGWEDSDPKALFDWFRATFPDDSFQIRRAIRYFKIWSLLKLESPPSSVLLTVLVGDAYRNMPDEDKSSDDVVLRGLAESIRQRLSVTSEVLNPINDSENLSRLSDEESVLFLAALEEFSNVAERAISAESEFETACIWSEIFEHFFPMPPSDTEEQQERALVPVAFIPRVSVTAVCGARVQINGVNAIGPIPRNCEITFRLDNFYELPYGARVSWMVRNDGGEAEYCNDLGHRAGDEPNATTEHSAYVGTHYMDVTIFGPFNEILGFVRVPVRINDTLMPRRNPRNRPYYLRFRNRKR